MQRRKPTFYIQYNLKVNGFKHAIRSICGYKTRGLQGEWEWEGAKVLSSIGITVAHQSEQTVAQLHVKVE